MAELVKPRHLNTEVAGWNSTMHTFLSIFFFSSLIIHDVTKRLLLGLKGYITPKYNGNVTLYPIQVMVLTLCGREAYP